MSHSRSKVVTVYRRLLRYVIPHWKVIPGAVIAMILVAAANAYVPLLMSQVSRRLRETTARVFTNPFGLLITFLFRGSPDFVAVYGLVGLEDL
ncbi:MAG: hypothetical protein CM1200mP36_01000 [Gammaproteobacteria bacterium]|nr:MAG: hypothetical protein CM1200mP36_01000 [Gammaproteobacteria bacterium]